MRKVAYLSFVLLSIVQGVHAQSVDDSFSKENMLKDLEIFKNIRIEANSGLYKYRTKEQIDSIYQWAEQEIENSSTYLDFYNIIFQLTDFEGSLHNATSLPEDYKKNLKQEKKGYFPYPIKWIEGHWIINFETDDIPLGSQIETINGVPMAEIIANLEKYFDTDGQNLTGKRIGIRTHFAKYYRLNYGQQEKFEVSYRKADSKLIENTTLGTVGYVQFYRNFLNRYSIPYDKLDHGRSDNDPNYTYKQIDSSTGLLTLSSFSIGNEKTEAHKTFLTFLDSVFINIKTENLKNLIVDVRNNGGGTDPNDLVSYSYLTERAFQENKEAWISFKKVPLIKYAYTKIPRFLRPIGAVFYSRSFKKEFPAEKNGRFYQDSNSADHKIRTPNKNAFTGNVYLLISPRVASAGSLFAAMLAGNENTTVIGEETMGGYYGHNGHTPLGYILPHSKIETFFSVVNLEQDVPEKSNQSYNRGVIPDYDVPQSHQDYLNHKDTQMDFVLDLIVKEGGR